MDALFLTVAEKNRHERSLIQPSHLVSKGEHFWTTGDLGLAASVKLITWVLGVYQLSLCPQSDYSIKFPRTDFFFFFF